MKKFLDHSLIRSSLVLSSQVLSSLILPVTILLFAACKKEGAQLVLKQGSFPSAGLHASTSTLVLSSASDGDSVLSFSWPAANFGSELALTYTLQLGKVSDTAGWTNAKTFTAGNNVLSYAFLGKDLNNLLNTMGLVGGSANAIAVRVRSDVDQYNGSASTVPSIYTNTVVLSVTPYGLSLSVPGAYQNWDPPSAPLLNPVPGKAGLYEGFVNISGSGIQYFKFTSAPDWNHINYGDGGNGTFSTDGAAAGLSVGNGGYYELTANLNNNTWTATPTTWGIIGDATPGGWNADTQMSYDAVNQVWTVTANMIQAGSFKFRANDAWNIDFGVDNSGNIQYADNPFFAYNPNLNNLTVSADGNYTITLDLHVSGKYTYKAVKN
jgi:starch-binding outer membrane protein SusE/F